MKCYVDYDYAGADTVLLVAVETVSSGSWICSHGMRRCSSCLKKKSY